MISPLESVFDAVYFDGLSTARQPARVAVTADAILLTFEDGETRLWPHDGSKLAADSSYGEPLRIERGLEALEVANSHFTGCLRQLAPQRFAASRIDALYGRSWTSVLLSSLVIVVIVTTAYFWGMRWMADQLARFAPRSLEERLGRSVVALLAPPDDRCSDPGVTGPLNHLAARLGAAAQSDYRIQVLCADNPLVNAFAAPGGTVVVFRGLLEEAESPEEVAGVLAHEIQHVTHRHATRALARGMSARALLLLLSVDPSGTPGAMSGLLDLASLNYQRSDEEEADREAVALLERAGIRGDALALFFRRLQRHSGSSSGLLAYLSTHPDLAARIQSVERAATRRNNSAPLLSDAEWESLRTACR